MRGRELADLDPADRARHVAPAPGPDPAVGTGRGWALPAADRDLPLEGAAPTALVPADVERGTRTGDPGARKRSPQTATVRDTHDTGSGAAGSGASDAGGTSRLHGGGRPA